MSIFYFVFKSSPINNYIMFYLNYNYYTALKLSIAGDLPEHWVWEIWPYIYIHIHTF